ncbi:UvrB/UvrC motif-containing protein [Candidatus Giovannonibacteria bacterium]|nr:UvrB/UvrC motif-containing protein [Candidatus Giovannonibacteria bacterium]
MLTREDFKKAPSSPGIYFFKDGAGKIIYIGKAQNLKLRLLSYANGNLVEARKKTMLEEAATIEWRELSSDIEALIEEAIAIKRYKTKYNIEFRDDKQYFFVVFLKPMKISKQKFPRVVITHQPQTINHKLKTVFIGPFTDGAALKSVLRMLERAFPYCTCKVIHMRPCVRSEIGRCLGICCVEEKEMKKYFPDWKKRERIYFKNIRRVRSILTGRKKDVITALTREMKQAAKNQNFENAKISRDQIRAVENVFRHRPFIKREINPERLHALALAEALLKLPDIPIRIEGYDMSNLKGKDAVGSMVVFENGEPAKSEYRLFKIRMKNPETGGDDTAMIQEVLSRRLRHDEWPLPDMIMIDGGLGQWSAAKKVLDLYQIPIPLTSLAKREEELWIGPSEKYALKNLSPKLLHLFGHIRNEAHRFAITFHRNRRAKSLFLQN